MGNEVILWVGGIHLFRADPQPTPHRCDPPVGAEVSTMTIATVQFLEIQLNQFEFPEKKQASDSTVDDFVGTQTFENEK